MEIPAEEITGGAYNPNQTSTISFHHNADGTLDRDLEYTGSGDQLKTITDHFDPKTGVQTAHETNYNGGSMDVSTQVNGNTVVSKVVDGTQDMTNGMSESDTTYNGDGTATEVLHYADGHQTTSVLKGVKGPTAQVSPTDGTTAPTTNTTTTDGNATYHSFNPDSSLNYESDVVN